MMGFKSYVSFGKVPKTTKGLHNYPMMGLKSYVSLYCQGVRFFRGPQEGGKRKYTVFYEVFFWLFSPTRAAFPTSTNGLRATSRAHLAAKGSLAGDKRGYKYPLGGIYIIKLKDEKQHHQQKKLSLTL